MTRTLPFDSIYSNAMSRGLTHPDSTPAPWLPVQSVWEAAA